MRTQKFYSKIFRILLLSGLLHSSRSHADMETTATLPQGVRSPKFLFGVMSGLTDHFTSDGRVEGLTDEYHVQLTGPTLSRLDPQLKTLVDELNAISNQHLGDAISLGTVQLKSIPVVSYFAPSLAYGVSNDFSVGIGVPFIHYRNDISVVQGGVNNVQAIHNSIGSLSTGNQPSQADTAFNTLAKIDLPSTVQALIRSRGYKDIKPVDSTSMGDVVVSGVYHYLTVRKWKLALRPFIQLPTGVKDDPDDLVDVPTGGQPAVGAYSIHDYAIRTNLTFTSSLGYQANLQDTVDVRVPSSSTDFLPGADRKDTVRRHTGNTTFLETGLLYKLSRPLELGAYYDLNYKDPDWYDGDHAGYDYSLLSHETASQTQMLKGALTFSTTEWFTHNAFAIPFQMVLVYGQTMAGENAPFSTVTQFFLRMFF